MHIFPEVAGGEDPSIDAYCNETYVFVTMASQTEMQIMLTVERPTNRHALKLDSKIEQQHLFCDQPKYTRFLRDSQLDPGSKYRRAEESWASLDQSERVTRAAERTIVDSILHVLDV